MFRLVHVVALIAHLPGVAAQCSNLPSVAAAIAAEYPNCFSNCTTICVSFGEVVTAYLTTFSVDAPTEKICEDMEEWECTITTASEACSDLLTAAETTITGLSIPRTVSDMAETCALLSTTSTTTTSTTGGIPNNAAPRTAGLIGVVWFSGLFGLIC
eukprot:Skav235332  [mRNA]  locus=scaffold520:677689:678159:+ [translate_table: standard]